jgi:hypothetical protein
MYIYTLVLHENDVPGPGLLGWSVFEFLDSNELWHENHGHVLFVVVLIVEVIVIVVIILQVNALLEIGIDRISAAQGPFRSTQLFGAWPHQAQWCAAGLLQPVPCETTLRQPLMVTRDNPTPPVPPLSGDAWRLQAGFWRWMQYVVCQFVGNGLVPWYVMKLGGLSARLLCHMEKGSMWTLLQSTIWGALSSPLWWVKANSSWFFQQCSGLSRCLPSMRVSEWTVVELDWG